MAEVTAGAITPPSPPRITGNPEQDQVALFNWAWDFYNAQIAANLAIEGTAVEIDPADLPDPATSSVAQAQETANEAFILAQTAKALAEAVLDNWVADSLTVAASQTEATYTFAEAQPDTSYFVVLSVASTTGTPAIDSTLVIGRVDTVDDFTITVNASTGLGNTVTFNFLLLRAPA